MRRDERVTLLERTNLRTLPPQRIDAPVDIVTLDLSFISVLKVLAHCSRSGQPVGTAFRQDGLVWSLSGVTWHCMNVV